MVRVVIARDEFFAQAHGEAPLASFELDAPFDEVVAALMPHREVPGPGFVAQARRNVADRLAFLDKHGAMTAEQVADFAQSSAKNRRQTAHRWASERRIFGVDHDGRTLYPGFQFDPSTRRPLPQVAEILARLPSGLAGWALALWWDTPLVDDGAWVAPVDVLDDVPRLLRLADTEMAGWHADGVA